MINFERFGSIGRALNNRGFLIFSMAAAPSQLGTWIQRVAIGWLTWELTESAAWLGIIAFSDLFPFVLVSPLAGVIADRFDRLRLVKIYQSVSLVIAAILGYLTFTGLITIDILLGLTTSAGIMSALYQPARQALVIGLVERKDLPAAVAINSMMYHSARFVGPALAGLIIVTWGVAPAFGCNALSYVIFISGVWRLRPRQIVADGPKKSIGGDIAAGCRYALTHKGIGPMLLMVLASSILVRPVTELLPGFAEGIFGRGPEGLAWMTSGAGLGAMFAGFWLAQRGTLTGLTGIVIAALLANAIAILAISVTPSFAVAVLCLVVIGFAMTANGTGAQTLIQSTADPTMHGRVLSFFGMAFLGGTAIGSLLIGWLSGALGLRVPAAAGAVLSLLVCAWLGTRRRDLARVLESD